MPGWVIATFAVTAASIIGLPIAAWWGWRTPRSERHQRGVK